MKNIIKSIALIAAASLMLACNKLKWKAVLPP